MDKAARLLSAGFLPKELPLEFESASLARVHRAIYAEILVQQAAKSLNISSAEPFNLVRREHATRTLRIINPVHFTKLASLLSSNWKTIRSAIDASSLSQSKPRFRVTRAELRSRATNHQPPDLTDLQLLSSAGKRYVLQTDFARFFPSIYSHSIPWALHGKAVAKRNRKINQLLGNELDEAVRSGQDGQTVGIPVGPDTSHILSELIAAKVDQLAFKRQPIGYRYIDDYFLAYDTEAEAMNALDSLVSAARVYELDLNFDKTRVRRTADLEIAFSHESLRSFSFADETKTSKKEIDRFFSIATELSRTAEYALKYAVSVFARRKIKNADWQIYESYLIRSANLSPNCLDVVAFSLYRHFLLGAPISVQRWTEFFTLIISDGIRYSRDTSVVWSLWAMKHLGMNIPRSLTKMLGKIISSPAALLCLDLEQRGLIQGNLDKSAWCRLLKTDELYGERWLLVYESLIKGWLQEPTGTVLANDPIFATMEARGVSFYDENRVAVVTQLLRGQSKIDARSLGIGPLQGFLLAIDTEERAQEPDESPKTTSVDSPQLSYLIDSGAFGNSSASEASDDDEEDDPDDEEDDPDDEDESSNGEPFSWY